MPTLPEAVFQRRLAAEYEEMRRSSYKFAANLDRTEYEIALNAAALQKINASISVRNDHKFKIILKRSYPYAGGFEVIWLSPIFHPNINEKDGKVCIQLINEWAASQTLLSLVKGIEHLLTHPNVKSPLNVDAGEYFYFHPELIEGKFGNIGKPAKPRILTQE